MALKSARFFKKDKRTREMLRSVKLRHSLLKELEEKLQLHLSTSEVVAFEVKRNVLPELLDVLDEDFLLFYTVEQIEDTVFAFRERVI